jgi:hypothetical protein
MKTRICILVVVSALICSTFCIGYAKSARLNEPTGPESTLLMGRIQLIGTNFPKNSALYGVHTNGISIELKDESNKFISVISRGNDGFFQLVDPDFTHFTIVGFSIQMSDTSAMWTIHYPANDVLIIQKNSVNNLGDILWQIEYGSSGTTEYKRRGPAEQNFSASILIEYKTNYEEVKSWFKETYPKSVWINKDWENTQIISEQ